MGHRDGQAGAIDLHEGGGGEPVGQRPSPRARDPALRGVDDQRRAGDLAQAVEHRIAPEQAAHGGVEPAVGVADPAPGPDVAVPGVVADEPVGQPARGLLAGAAVVPLVEEPLGGGGLAEGRPVRLGTDQDQRGDPFRRDKRGPQGGEAPLRGTADDGAFGADRVEHGQRVAGRGPVGEGQPLVFGAAVTARVPGDDPEFGCECGLLRGEHRAIHEEFVGEQHHRTRATAVLVVDVGVDRAGEWHEDEDSQSHPATPKNVGASCTVTTASPRSDDARCLLAAPRH